MVEIPVAVVEAKVEKEIQAVKPEEPKPKAVTEEEEEAKEEVGKANGNGVSDSLNAALAEAGTGARLGGGGAGGVKRPAARRGTGGAASRETMRDKAKEAEQARLAEEEELERKMQEMQEAEVAPQQEEEEVDRTKMSVAEKRKSLAAALPPMMAPGGMSPMSLRKKKPGTVSADGDAEAAPPKTSHGGAQFGMQAGMLAASLGTLRSVKKAAAPPVDPLSLSPRTALKTFACPECRAAQTSEERLQEHLKGAHKKAGAAAEQILEGVRSKAAAAAKQNEEKSSSSGASLLCLVCRKEHSSKEDLQTHLDGLCGATWFVEGNVGEVLPEEGKLKVALRQKSGEVIVETFDVTDGTMAEDLCAEFATRHAQLAAKLWLLDEAGARLRDKDLMVLKRGRVLRVAGSSLEGSRVDAALLEDADVKGLFEKKDVGAMMRDALAFLENADAEKDIDLKRASGVVRSPRVAELDGLIKETLVQQKAEQEMLLKSPQPKRTALETTSPYMSSEEKEEEDEKEEEKEEEPVQKSQPPVQLKKPWLEDVTMMSQPSPQASRNSMHVVEVTGESDDDSSTFESSTEE